VKSLRMLLMAIVFAIVSFGISPIQAGSPAEEKTAAIILAHYSKRYHQHGMTNRQRQQRQMQENQRRRYYREKKRRETRQFGQDMHHAVGHHGGGCFIGALSE